MRRPSRVSLAIPLFVAFTLSGCSIIGAGSDSGSTATATPAKKPAAAPKTTPPPVLSAADGTDLKACKKAKCQVIVRGQKDVPIGSKYGFVDLKLTHVKPNRLAFVVVRTELGMVSGHVAGTGRIGLANGVLITVEKMTPKGAVVRFERKTLDKEADKVSGSEGASTYGYGS